MKEEEPEEEAACPTASHVVMLPLVAASLCAKELQATVVNEEDCMPHVRRVGEARKVLLCSESCRASAGPERSRRMGSEPRQGDLDPGSAYHMRRELHSVPELVLIPIARADPRSRMNEKAVKVAGGKGSAIEILQACRFSVLRYTARSGSSACLPLLARQWLWSRKAVLSCSEAWMQEIGQWPSTSRRHKYAGPQAIHITCRRQRISIDN